MNPDFIWWITAFELPALAGLLMMIWRNRKDSDDAYDTLAHLLEQRSAQLREVLANYKLEVAKTYASASDVKELETKLVAYLLRIETKLELRTDALARKDRP